MRQTKEVSRVISEKDIDIYIESHTNMLKLAEYVKQNPSCSDAACLLQHSILAHTRNLSPWKLLFSPSAFKEIIQNYPIIDTYCRPIIDILIGPNYSVLRFKQYNSINVSSSRIIQFDVNKNALVTNYELNYNIIYHLTNINSNNFPVSNILKLAIPCSIELYEQLHLTHPDQLPQSIVDDCLLCLLNFCESEMTQST